MEQIPTDRSVSLISVVAYAAWGLNCTQPRRNPSTTAANPTASTNLKETRIYLSGTEGLVSAQNQLLIPLTLIQLSPLCSDLWWNLSQAMLQPAGWWLSLEPCMTWTHPLVSLIFQYYLPFQACILPSFKLCKALFTNYIKLWFSINFV